MSYSVVLPTCRQKQKKLKIEGTNGEIKVCQKKKYVSKKRCHPYDVVSYGEFGESLPVHAHFPEDDGLVGAAGDHLESDLIGCGNGGVVNI